jgi:tRNA U34 5-carboxymethylaminomethyl modifying GTPase MnmE/TrmE
MSSNNLKIVLVGETAVGKSQLGNFILNKECFKVGNTINSETGEISEETSLIKEMNINVTIVDTPGLNHTGGQDKKIMDKIVNKFKNDNSIDGLILVYSYRNLRKVQKSKELLDNLKQIFGEDLLQNRLKVIFTNSVVGEERDNEDEKERNIKVYIKNFLYNMVEEEDMIFVNTKIKRFRPIILDLLKKFLEIKRKDGSINNANMKKKQLKFIGGLSLEDIQKQIYYYEKQKSDTEQKIRRLQSEKSSCIAGTILSSIFLPFTLGISSVGVAETTMDRNVINRQISELEDDLRNYNRRLNLYYKKEAELLK